MDRQIRWTKWDKLATDVADRLKDYLLMEPNPTVSNRFYEIEYLNKEMMAPVKCLCYILHVSRSGYYKWLQNRDNKFKREEELLNDILLVIKKCDGAAGIKRITKQVNAIRIKENRKPCSQPTVYRLVRKYGLFSLGI